MTIKNIIYLTAIIFTLSLVPVSAKEKQVDTRIVLDKNSTKLLVVENPKTEVITGISKDSMDELNNNPNPELIKQYICSIAPEYGVDWKLVYAIGYHESGNYNSSLAQRNNNYFGRKASSGGYASWATPEEGIRNQVEYIKNMYYSRGLTTPEAINPIYAEDGSWCIAINRVMNSL